MANPTPPPQFDVPAGLEPLYTNLARISHSPTELVIDFSRILPGEASIRVLSRMVMTPASAKLLCRALTENLGHYEASYGEIKLPGDNTLAAQLFRSARPPEPPPAGEDQ